MCIIQNINLEHAKCGVCVHCMWKSLETGRYAVSTGGSESSVFLAALRLLKIHLAILQLKAFLVLIFLCLFPDMKSTQVLCSPEPFGVMCFTLCGSSVPHAGGLLTIWVQLLIFFQGDLHLQSLCSGNHQVFQKKPLPPLWCDKCGGFIPLHKKFFLSISFEGEMMYLPLGEQHTRVFPQRNISQEPINRGPCLKFTTITQIPMLQRPVG